MKKSKLVWSGNWYYRRHNNCRYSSLLPRLRAVQPKYRTLSRWRAISGIQWRLYRVLDVLWKRQRMQSLAKNYCGLFCTDIRQIGLFPGPIVLDIDDPVFDSDLSERLSDPHLVGVVTTTQYLQDQLMGSGLKVPCYVLPSGVDLTKATGLEARRLASRYPRALNTVRLGYALPKFYLDEELYHQPEERYLHSISWLLSVMRIIWEQRPETELWIIGQPSKLAERLCNREPRIHLLGYIQHDNVLTYYSLFDIAMYPRLIDVQGRHSIKLVEFMACGLPIVSTNVSESFRVREAKAGLICDNEQSFTEGVLRLSSDLALRKELGENGRRYAQQFGWDNLAQRYDKEILQPIINRLTMGGQDGTHS